MKEQIEKRLNNPPENNFVERRNLPIAKKTIQGNTMADKKPQSTRVIKEFPMK